VPTLFRFGRLNRAHAMGGRLSQPAAPPQQQQPQSSTFTPLARVEVQLVMQFLDALSLLRLAHCERRLLADSRSAFAWRHARGMPLDVGPLLLLLPRNNDRCRLPRTFHIPVRLCLHNPLRVRDGWARPAAALMELLREVPGDFDLREIDDSSSDRIADVAWFAMLQLPVACGLRRLSLGYVAPQHAAALWERIGTLSQLMELDLLQWNIAALPDARALTSALAAAPVLNSLHCCTRLWQSLVLQPTPLVRPLRRLHLVGDTISSVNMQRLLSVPSLAQLQELSLRSTCIARRAEAEANRAEFESAWRAVWSGLPLLHTLTIQSIVPIELFLQTLSAAPSLQQLRVVLAVHNVLSDPSAAMLEPLLVSCPLLHITVFAPRLDCLLRPDEAHGDKLNGPQRNALQLQELATVHAQRVSIWPFAPDTN